MYQCCIFDLDGTIINTIPSLKKTIDQVLKEFGFEPLEESYVKRYVGDGYKTLVERILRHYGDQELTLLSRALTVYQEKFKKYCLYKLEPYPGVMEFLVFLKERGIRLAVVTNKSHQCAVECVELVYGKGFFDRITGEGQGMKCKPDPEGVFSTIRALGVEAVDCLYFGDTNTDMETGHRAGMDTVGVLWGFRDEEELKKFHPRYIISHPDEIRPLFQKT